MTLLDFHTHNLNARQAIISVSPSMLTDSALPAAAPLSVGIHPWNTFQPVDFQQLSMAANDPRVVAIGETGLDPLRGANLEQQVEIFCHHVALSEQLFKPLVIHCVKAWDLLLKLKKELKPSQPWAVHGFRGGEQLARQLTAHGLFISLGEKFNPDAARIIPADKILAETDESLMPIEQIISNITAHRNTETPIAENISSFLHKNRH